MPRQIDLFPQNLQVNNDPTNRLGVTAAQINHLNDQIPAALAKAQSLAITNFLTLLDQETGLDLLGWWKDTQDLLNFINAATQQSWMNFQNLVNSIAGGIDKDITDLIAALNSTSGDAATATANWDTLFLDLGFSVTTAAQLASWLGGTNTTAVNGKAWVTRMMNDWQVIGDFFHLTYHTGTSSDAPGLIYTGGGLGNGKMTWWGAWNDYLVLIGLANSIATPAQAAADIGTAITTNAGTVQTHLNNVVSHFTGTTVTADQTTADAGQALSLAANTLSSVTGTVQAIQTQLNSGAGAGGASYAVQFNTYPDGAFPSVFTLTYTGTGTGHLSVTNSAGHWVPVNNGDRSVFGYYNAGVTYSDYQQFRGAITSIPGAGAKNAAVLRCNSAQTTYVYGEIYLDTNYNLTYEVGCVVSGTKTVFDTGPAPLALDFEFYAGVSGTLNRYQGFAGGKLVFDYTDTANVFTPSIGSANRGWAFISSTSNSGQAAPADASYAVCEDNDPTLAVGSGFSAYYNSTSSVSGSHAASTNYAFPSGLFNIIAQQTADITGNGNAITVTRAGWYDMTVQVEMGNFSASLGMVTIVASVSQNGALAKLIPGNGVAYNIAGAQDYTPWFGGTTSIYCHAGDTISPGYYIGGVGVASNLTFIGDGSGIQTYWSVRLANRSIT